MIILGIDPGYAITGYGVIEYSGNHFKLITCGWLVHLTITRGTDCSRLSRIVYDFYTVWRIWQSV